MFLTHLTLNSISNFLTQAFFFNTMCVIMRKINTALCNTKLFITDYNDGLAGFSNNYLNSLYTGESFY